MIRLILLVVMASSSLNTFAQSEETVGVFRWQDTVRGLYRTVAENEYTDSQLMKEGWTNKKLIFLAYCDPGPGRIAVYDWYNAFSWSHLSIAEDEATDAKMEERGYSRKHFQFYALNHRDHNTVGVYRWLMPHGLTWINVPENTNTDDYFKKGYRKKTYQYYGLFVSN